jgi:hypothetical protein
MRRSINRISAGLVFFSLFALGGCGGGGASGVSATPVAATGSATGVITDSAIQGVSYGTSSGITGTTDASGHYSDTPGDTVTFKIGFIALGKPVTATGLVTL